MNDAKTNRTPRPRPNFEVPAKRLSVTMTEDIQIAKEEPQQAPKDESEIKPIFRTQTDTASVIRRFGGSVRDVQRSKGTLRTRGGWIVGNSSPNKPSTFGGRRESTTAAPPTILEDSTNGGNIDKAELKPVLKERESAIEDKENVAEDSGSPIEPIDSFEDSMTKLQDDITQEIEAVSILLDSPIDEKNFSPTVEDVRDESEVLQEDPQPESPAPLKISRSQPVDIKPAGKVLHSSQQPEPALPVSSSNKVQYQVNAPPTPGSTPPELEKRPKFEDRGVPTHAPVAPPTPPTKVMIVENDKVVGEMTLDDGKGDGGYNVQDGKNPNAVAVSSEVSKIASKISELQLKADPSKPAPKPSLPSITMDDFVERNQPKGSPPKSVESPSEPTADLRAGFGRHNSMPVMPSQVPMPEQGPAARKVYEPRQYQPYRPPAHPQAMQPPFPPRSQQQLPTSRGALQQSIQPPPCPSPAPSGHSTSLPQAMPQHLQNQGRHSSLGNIHQYGQPLPPQPAPMRGYGQPLPWQRNGPTVASPNQIVAANNFQRPLPPPHSSQRQAPMGQNHTFSNDFAQRRGSVPPSHAQPTNVPSIPPVVIQGHVGRALPALPAEPPVLAIEQPRTPEPIANEVRPLPKPANPLPARNQAPPAIPTFSFDEPEEPRTRSLPSVPKPSAPIPAIAFDNGASDNSTKPSSSIPTFSFSDDTKSSPPVPSISVSSGPAAKPPVPILNLPDDDEEEPANSSVPTFSFAGPEESTASRPLPTPTAKQESRPLPTPKAGANNNIADRRAAFETHGYNPVNRVPMTRSAASCTACSNHISARAVAASGLRFHPECFRCSHCHTRLEHVAFYPEPPAPDAPEDAPLTGRFYCHLDFHELFSPRCKSCKTPIEGEVVEACGATWHPGHFFCAECGDVSIRPFLRYIFSRRKLTCIYHYSHLTLNRGLWRRTSLHGA